MMIIVIILIILLRLVRTRGKPEEGILTSVMMTTIDILDNANIAPNNAGVVMY